MLEIRKLEMPFRIFVIIFGVAIVLGIFKYWGQSFIDKSVLSSYQKLKSNFWSGVDGQNIYVTSEKFIEENQALRREISWLKRNTSHIMETFKTLHLNTKILQKNLRRMKKPVVLCEFGIWMQLKVLKMLRHL